MTPETTLNHALASYARSADRQRFRYYAPRYLAPCGKNATEIGQKRHILISALKVRRKQFEAMLDPAKTVVIARAIVGTKIKAEGHAPPIERAFLAGLRAARTTDDVRHVEAKAAQVWWSQWTRFEMRFAGAGVPADWHSWPGRSIHGAKCHPSDAGVAEFTP